MDPTKEQRQILCKSQKKCETLAMIRQPFGKGRINSSRKVQIRQDRKDEIGEEQSQEHAHHFLWHHYEFVMAGQTVYSAYYCDVLRLLRENV
jgi:hypothetical protein